MFAGRWVSDSHHRLKQQWVPIHITYERTIAVKELGGWSEVSIRRLRVQHELHPAHRALVGILLMGVHLYPADNAGVVWKHDK
jgi:hypothetical protein